VEEKIHVNSASNKTIRAENSGSLNLDMYMGELIAFQQLDITIYLDIPVQEEGCNYDVNPWKSIQNTNP